MAKRFIDTGLFDDSWFMNLTNECKLFWIYCITKCNHAGIIELNGRLVKFQIGINSIETVIKGLGNRLVSVKEKYYFIPKFLEYQYPNFPNSKVKSQKSAMDILSKFNIDYNNIQTVSKPLPKGYENGTDYGNGIETESENKAKQVVIYPFESKTFSDQWQYWKNYKSKEFNFKYKTIQSEQAALKKLANLSGNNEEIAIQIIHESFANSWKGFFKLKNDGKQGHTAKRDQYFREHDPDYQNY